MKITRWGQGPTASTSSDGQPSGPAGGDLGGSYPAPNVDALRGTPICVTTPTTGQALVFNGAEWCPANAAGVLEVKETDGAPDVTGVSIIQVPPGGLTNNSGGNVTLEYIPDRNGAIENLNTVSASGATQALNWSLYNEHDITLTANCTISFTSVPNVSGKGAAITIILRQDGTGSRTVTWPGTITWITGSAPTLKTAAAAIDVITIFTTDGGTTFGGAAVGQGISPLTTKGDLFTYSTTNVRLPVGSVGQVLQSSPSETTGLLWTDPQQHTHVDNVVFSGDGSTTVFVLPAAPLDAYSVSVYVTASRSQDWTLSGSLLDTLTFGTAPPSAANNIVVDITAVLV